MSRPSPTPAPRARAARRALGRLAALAALVAGAACTENLESGLACPALCPDQNLAILDTIIEPTLGGFGTVEDSAALDTTLASFPGIGSEGSLLLANRTLNGADTLLSYAVIRFDTLPSTFTRGGVDSTIYAIDSVYLQILVDTVSARRRVSGPVTLEVFDVDTAVTGLADTSAATLLPLFRESRLIGSRVVPPESLRDSVQIPLDGGFVLSKILDPTRPRLRIGLRARTDGAPVQLRIGATNGGRPARLNYDPSPDTAVPPRRAFLRFYIPPEILDSSTIIRATLLLTQRPDPRAEVSDTVTVQPLVVRASSRLDVGRAASVLDYANVFAIDSMRLVSRDSGVREFEIVRVIRGVQTSAGVFPGWSQVPREQQQHAIVLRAVREGELPVEALFFSSEAPAAVRPRLRLSYVPSVPLGTR